MGRRAAARVSCRTMSGQSADVVICGGGVLGAALAYELAGRGARPLLIESRTIASGASGKAAGLLSPASDARAVGPLGELWRASLARHHALVGELAAQGAGGYGFEESPSLLITADAAEAQTLRATAPAQWLEPDEVRARCAWIDGPIEGGVLREASAEIEPAAFTQALIQAAETRGARVHQARVTGLSLNGRSVTGVRLDSQTVRTATVVLAMGPWTSTAAEWIGSPVPITPLKGQILRLRLPPAAAETRFSDTDGNYMARKADGLVYVGTTEERRDSTRRRRPRRETASCARPDASSPRCHRRRWRNRLPACVRSRPTGCQSWVRRRGCPARSSPRGTDARACCLAPEAPPPWPPKSPANPPPSTSRRSTPPASADRRRPSAAGGG